MKNREKIIVLRVENFGHSAPRKCNSNPIILWYEILQLTLLILM